MQDIKINMKKGRKLQQKKRVKMPQNCIFLDYIIHLTFFRGGLPPHAGKI